LSISHDKTSLLDTFKKADDVLLQAVKGISDLINIRGLINLDFADIRTVMSSQGMAIMGTGAATGDNRAVEAATQAISSPLLENISIDGATGIIINITGGKDLSLHEVDEASTLITEAAHEDAEIIFGAVIDEALGDEVRVTVIATGFGAEVVKIAGTNVYNYQVQPAPQYSAHPQYFQQPAMPQYQPTAQPSYAPAQQHMGQPHATMQQQPPVAAMPQMNSNPMNAPQAATQQHPLNAPVEQPIAPPVAMSGATHEGMSHEGASMEDSSSPRDLLLAKAKAYREQAMKQKEAPQEQLSMEVNLDHNNGKKAVDLSSPFDQSNLDVPTYLRRKNLEGTPE